MGMFLDQSEMSTASTNGGSPGAGPLHDDADAAEHALVAAEPRAEHHRVQPRQPLVYLLDAVLGV